MASEAAPPSAAVEAVASVPTPRNADVVAFCPYANFTHVVACGCYELDDSVQPVRRHGRLALLTVDQAKGSLTETSAVEGVGVLDCVWLVRAGGEEAADDANNPAPQLIAAATSACDARIYPLLRAADGEDEAIADGAPRARLGEACATMPCEDAGDACMSLDWSSAGSGDGSAVRSLALSSTAGRVYVGALHGAAGAADGLRLVTSWQAHDLEGWAVAFDPRSPTTLYTGADDAQLKIWDLRCALSDAGSAAADSDDEGARQPAALASNRRSHRAGVCVISPSRAREHVVATGSYDEHASGPIGSRVRRMMRWQTKRSEVWDASKYTMVPTFKRRKSCKHLGKAGWARAASIVRDYEAMCNL